MRRNSRICYSAVFVSHLPFFATFLLVLFLVPMHAVAQEAAGQPSQAAGTDQAPAQEAAGQRRGPAPGSPFAIRAAAQKKAVQDGEALPTPKLADGHVDLNGRWAQVKMYCDKDQNCTLATGKLLSGYEVFKDKNGAIHAETPPSRPLTGDENSRAIAFELQKVLNQGGQRGGSAPPYKQELLAKVADLNLHENQVDPASILCHPAGIPRDGAPARIVAAPGTAVFMYSGENGNYWRIVPTDGRAHRTDIDPAYFGDSVAHWDGDTLVVDVNNFTDDTWMGSNGWFHSDAMHVVERIARQGSILHYQATVDDPIVLTKPWVKNPETLMVYTDPDSEIYEQARCVNEDLGHFVNHDHF